MKGFKIEVDHSSRSNRVIDLADLTWKTLGEEVEGVFEIVRLHHLATDCVIVVNDCGAINDMPLNSIASIVAGQWIYGPAVILREGMTEDGPDLMSLTDDQIELMTVLYR